MLKKFNWDPEKIPKILKLNNNSAESSVSPELIKAQKNILMKAALAFLTIVLTIVILFAMTSAWYTNIVHTSGLVFEVESWGFDGKITVEQGPVMAGPGDSGIIGLSMDGTAGEILDVSIGVSKEDMLVNGENLDEDAMKKRFFFYVDKPGIKNDEQVDRFYINNTEDYTYTVFSEGSIRISEDFSNVPELKWQWVYDVLGYYVKANYDGEETFIIQEYLRPIEYDFDKATFEPLAITVSGEEDDAVINTKRIATVDGERTPEQFLADFSKNDGYAGEIIVNSEEGENLTKTIVTADGKKYYKVAEGIYAYLCDYQEIEAATKFDTALGKMAGNKSEMTQDALKALQFPATVNISVQNREETESVEVTALDTDIISENSGKVIKLANDVALTESLVIPENSNVEIDLNGKTVGISLSDSKAAAIEVPEGSSLVMMNGKVESGSSEEKKGRGILATGAEVTLSGIEINGFDYGLRVTDNAATNKTDSVIRLYNCKTDAGTCGVYILGNGEASEQKTQLIIEKSELFAEGFALCGGGNPDSRGTDIRIIGSTLKGTGDYSVGIYQPQKDGETVIFNSTIEAHTGIALKAGIIEIIDSNIRGTGSRGEPGYAVSGSKDTGDAVYIEANYGHPIGLIIRETGAVDEKGNLIRTVLNSINGNALQVYEPDAPNVIVEIISGTFSSEVSEKWVADGSVLSGDKKAVTVSASAQTETE